MGYTFTFGDIERMCKSLRMTPLSKGSRYWVGTGSDGVLRRTRVDSLGRGRVLATGTARIVAKQLGFRDLEGMYEYLRKL